MKNWKVPAITVVGIACVLFMCIFGVQSSKNKAIVMEQSVKTAMSDIEVQEMSRISKLPNLVDAVKHYDKHEAETLQAIVAGRGSAGDIENVTTVISSIAEAYPELKSSENYQTLMKEIATIENLLVQYRTNYNKQVGTYNRYVRGFPARIFLSWTGYEAIEYQLLDFEAPAEAPTNLFGD